MPPRTLRSALPRAALALTTLAACGDHAAVTSPGERVAPAPLAATVGAGTAARGATVSRFSNTTFLTFADTGQRLVLTAGLEATPQQFCGGLDAFSPSREQQVATPAGTFHYTARSDEARLVLYADVPNDPEFSYCRLGVDAPVVATGVGAYRLNYHERGAAGSDYGRLTGTVAFVDGGRARVTAKARFRLRADGTVAVDMGEITLTPARGR